MSRDRKTAFVLAGGGSLGAIQVGMLLALAKHGVKPDLIVGSSVGAINAAYCAADSSVENVMRLANIWRRLQRRDVFPINLSSLANFIWRRDFLVSHSGIRQLVRAHLPYERLEQAKIPVHIVATDILSGQSVVLSDGAAEDAIVASTAIPGVFPPIRYKGTFLADGAVSSNTPVHVALQKGATRLVVLPTGYACANGSPPMGAIANALHALTLLIARQLAAELEAVPTHVECNVVPPICPFTGSPYDFSMTPEHIERGFVHTESWLHHGGLERPGVPGNVRPHAH